MSGSDKNQRIAPLALRERRRLDTAADIANAALDLFESQGVESTTVADIANASGISSRTFFRYFPSKEAAALSVQVTFDEAIAQLLDDIDPNTPILTQIENAYDRVLEDLDDSDGHVRSHVIRLRRLMSHSSALRSAVQKLNEESNEDLAQKIVSRVRLKDGIDEARSVVFVAGFVVGQAFECWVRDLEDSGSASLPAAYARAKLRMRRILVE
jgi:AcrR family transcriptional regulator